MTSSIDNDTIQPGEDEIEAPVAEALAPIIENSPPEGVEHAPPAAAAHSYPTTLRMIGVFPTEAAANAACVEAGPSAFVREVGNTFRVYANIEVKVPEPMVPKVSKTKAVESPAEKRTVTIVKRIDVVPVEGATPKDAEDAAEATARAELAKAGDGAFLKRMTSGPHPRPWVIYK